MQHGLFPSINTTYPRKEIVFGDGFFVVQNGDDEGVENELIFQSQGGGAIVEILVEIKGRYQGVTQMNFVHFRGQFPSRFVGVVS